jgi:hypothetical protein
MIIICSVLLRYTSFSSKYAFFFLHIFKALPSVDILAIIIILQIPQRPIPQFIKSWSVDPVDPEKCLQLCFHIFMSAGKRI